MASYSMDAEVSDEFFVAMDSARKVVEEEVEEEEVDLEFTRWGKNRRSVEEEEEEEEPWPRRTREVMLEGYVDGPAAGGDDRESVGVARMKSLTDEDLEELKGCLDLGFSFSYEEIPELCGTLPALELCYAMNQRFLDEQQHSSDGLPSSSSSSSSGEFADSLLPPIANWKISNPGDNPDDVKVRLKYWAQAVACTVKLCR